MDSAQLLSQGQRMLGFVANYWDTMRENTKPLPEVKPDYIRDSMPDEAPQEPEEWDAIFSDLDNVVMRGNANWQHPHFFAYFAAGCTAPGIIGDILSGGIGGVGFTWQANPAMTELELSVTDWLVNAMGLPEHFKNSHPGPGCGIIQATACESTMVAVMAARARMVEKVKKGRGWLRSANSPASVVVKKISAIVRRKKEKKDSMDDIIVPHSHDPAVFARFVAYCSDQAHSSVEKAAMICGVKLRKLNSTLDRRLGNYTVSAETLKKAIKIDRAGGLIPFVMVATMGTTNTCAVDYVKDLGPICNQEGIWLHVDAAYAGAFLMLPRYRYMSEGMETVDSFNFNAHKALFINFDCSPMFKNGEDVAEYFNVEATYLKSSTGGMDYRNLQLPLSRRFRSLKLWFVLRSFGVKKLQEMLQTMCNQAEVFSSLIKSDSQFELFVPQHLGLVCFRLAKRSNAVNESFLNAINTDGRIHMIPSTVHGVFVIRFTIVNTNTTAEDVRYAFDVVRELSQKFI